MKYRIMKLFWNIKRLFLNDAQKRVFIDKDVVIRKNVSVKSHNGCINLGKGTILEKNTRVAALDGGQINVGENVYFNESCKIISRDKICIGDNTLFGPDVYIYDHDHIFDYDGVDRQNFKCSPVIIEDNCWIGAKAVILRGTHIGKGTVIGAGTIVKGDIPEHSIVKSSKSNIIEKIRKYN